MGRSNAMRLKVKGLNSDFQWRQMAAEPAKMLRLRTMGPQPEFLPCHAVAAISSSCKRFNHARSRWNLGRYQQNAKHSCCIFLQDEITRIFGIVRHLLKPIVDIFDVLLVQLWICKVRMDCPTGLSRAQISSFLKTIRLHITNIFWTQTSCIR